MKTEVYSKQDQHHKVYFEQECSLSPARIKSVGDPAVPSIPVAHALRGAVSVNRSPMKPGFARVCFLVLKTRTRKK